MCSILVLVAIYVPMAAMGYYNLGHQVKTNIVDSVCNGTVNSKRKFFAQQFTRELINLLLHCTYKRLATLLSPANLTLIGRE
jgi:hypothetical protein